VFISYTKFFSNYSYHVSIVFLVILFFVMFLVIGVGGDNMCRIFLAGWHLAADLLHANLVLFLTTIWLLHIGGIFKTKLDVIWSILFLFVLLFVGRSNNSESTECFMFFKINSAFLICRPHLLTFWSYLVSCYSFFTSFHNFSSFFQFFFLPILVVGSFFQLKT
jgi:hypothetical protein